METVSLVLIAYLVGAIPIGVLLTRWLRGVDLRHVGSGNPGAANAYRAAGLRTALLVMGADAAKGAGSVALATRFADGAIAPVAAAVAAVVGHVFPVWLRFRGGKGVATAAGAFAVLAPAAAALALVVFVLTAWITRYVSLASVVASTALPPIAVAVGAPGAIVVGGAATAVLVIVRHRTNLARVLAGTERRLGDRAGGAS